MKTNKKYNFLDLCLLYPLTLNTQLRYHKYYLKAIVHNSNHRQKSTKAYLGKQTYNIKYFSSDAGRIIVKMSSEVKRWILDKAGLSHPVHIDQNGEWIRGPALVEKLVSMRPRQAGEIRQLMADQRVSFN